MKTAVLAAQAGYSLTESFSRWREGECVGNASSNRETADGAILLKDSGLEAPK